MAARFYRFDGLNWERREFYVAEPVRAIGEALIDTWPLGKPTDGTVASKGHDAVSPWSDHRPRPFTGRGIVRAIDIGVSSDAEGHLIAGILRLVPSVNYVLFGEEDNHPTHVHVSTKSTHDLDARKVHMLTQKEVAELKQTLAEMDALDSDLSGAMRVLVGLARREREMPLHDPVMDGGGGLNFGDTVKLNAP